ncbi:MAG: ChbG/HpnK family deacetylase [Ruminococcaceae bacterium]|nr:ChbG/HpnK family deacetylase [Oscillospiraceae bacterium]
MIYYCADDYGLDETSSLHIRQCIAEGVLNKVSVFPNFENVDLHKLSEQKDVRLSLHLNLVEGRCMADASRINLIADQNGNFRYTFGGLFRLGLLHRKELEEQLYREIKAQILYWKSILPAGAPFCIDSHQHTHMIPAVFKALLRVLKEEDIKVDYLRIPAEPLLPYLTTPSLYATYSGINLIKQWLLKFLWQWNRKYTKNEPVSTSCFFGILFSGRMDEKRVRKLLPKYQRLAEKRGFDIEVLFHPGYLKKINPDFKDKNIVFEAFYLSENRKTEYDSVMKI